MGLDEYHRKRDFAKTPEPRGKAGRRKGWSFVVQKHAATRLHYDFRLELDGVLKSWAVPKGPSFDPKEKRLAMRTEDHPLDYADFEGVIPEGQYGGGTVLLWDRGTWEALEDPHKGFETGKLKFALQGEKLKGAWTLVKIRGRDPRDSEKTWLLIKERDGEVRPAAEYDVVEERPESITTGRSLEEIAADRDRIWNSKVVETSRSGRLQAALDRMRQRSKAAAPSPPASAKRTPAARPARKAAPGLATLPGAKKAALPSFVQPQLATLVTEPPAGDEWLHEMKFDGYRILGRLDQGEVQLLSRNGKEWTAHFEPVARATRRLDARQALVDGEVAVLLTDGRTSFNALQNAPSQEGGRLTYFVFDLLYLDGYDLRRVPLRQRKEALRGLLGGASGEVVRFSDHVAGSGDAFFREACRLGLEGIVSKRGDAPYEAGRGRAWLKVKCVREQEFVIGGFTDPEGTRLGLGALLLGVYDEAGRFVFAGKVGTGFTDKSAVDLRRRLDRLEEKTCPFITRPPGTARAHWVRPELVAAVAFSEWTSDGRLRHPSFKGLRQDKPARQVVREQPQPTDEVTTMPETKTKAKTTPKGAASVMTRPARKETPKSSRKAGAPAARRRAERPRRLARSAPATSGPATNEVAGVRLTHADRVLYPDQNVTKRDLALFYEEIADWILPHLVDRPTTLVRCPEGMSQPCFYQKHTGWWAPPELRRVPIQEKTKVGEYLVVDDLSALVGLVQIGILEIHTWNSTVARLEQPDRAVFDLDPGPDVPWKRVVDAARRVRERLLELGLESFVKTTGGKGLHVVVPLALQSWDEGTEFSRAVAVGLAREDPAAYVADMSKALRKGRIFVDYLRNVRGATSVAAYSTRARAGAPISVPLSWDELGTVGASDQFTIANLRARLAALKSDPWKRYGTLRQKLTAAMKRAAGPTN